MHSINRLHPFALFFYFIAEITVTMLFFHPVFILVSLLSSVLLCLFSNGAGSVCSSLILFLLISLTNPLFSHNGATPLLFIGGNAVTLEAIIYGVIMGAMFISVLFWLRCFNFYITSDKLIYIFGKLAPKLALIISMVLHFVPQLVKKGKDIYAVQRLMLSDGKGKTAKIKLITAVMSSLVSQSLENSVETADSMSARGYGTVRRTNSLSRNFTAKDIIFTSFVFIMLCVIFLSSANGGYYFSCYPYIMNISVGTEEIIGYLCFFFMSIMPSLIFITGEIKWKYSISKI